MNKHPSPLQKNPHKTPIFQALLKIQYPDPPTDAFRIFRSPLNNEIPTLTKNEESVEELF